ncbi:hypothetical protein E4P40_13215 [Blastococcus sp. CT_GayMR20]|uniref:hypothetical protein n=1 Tax=Blastococcus sp. CT_GayMR20 TaxID=2559609 RepID=UPI001073D7F0|nr:hypothetical protein [Blastococcus sp. CT_GayMR20]TFV86200.1 hypothetical protein E4P40_13060 [Blastococcus sp. CT_GayMR20]TFV86227.1 hypothetical protein E4P40_13215 [Blastococcus sp. CT_GayMR20]
MPLTRRKGTVCTEHGENCKLAGGSDFTSARCARKVADAFGRPVAAPGPDTELEELSLLAAAQRDGLTVEEARAHRDAARETRTQWWNRLSPFSRAQDMDGADEKMSAAVREVKAKQAAERAAEAERVAAEEAARPVGIEPAAPSARATGQRRRLQRPQEPTGVGVGSPVPPAPVAEQPPARRRRRRGPQFSSINTWRDPDEDEGDDY